MNRINSTFERLKHENKKAFISFTMAGDPHFEKSLEIVQALPSVGVDIIELGIPFSDPMADGPAIQLAGQRALASGMNLKLVLDMVYQFRKSNNTTPIVLMGYFNPIYRFGISKFLDNCMSVGVDGLIVVDLPPEEDRELCIPAIEKGLNFIRLATPTSDKKRLETVLMNTSGFIYYVSVTGITGTTIETPFSINDKVTKLKKLTSIPVCVGFGIKNKEMVAQLCTAADGVVVGSAIVQEIAQNKTTKEIICFCENLAEGTKL